ncbi:hypothetical protein AAC387_Pa08g1839 [Persea americana]|eukprot:TRINITY_DN2809_c2_g1_i1.p1 TRINITY_DN2809_c2_g1~~TRINITY_DN2809_c2_g1_i1.p1  ORF type:complete len:452 (+),score=31.33 TRINITY_DN2809_c2_g1_i1:226-1581(+)
MLLSTTRTLSSYKNIIFQALLSLSLSLLLFPILNLPTLFLSNLHTYIHPENLSSDPNHPSVRASIRRPDSHDHPDPKRRPRSKDKFEFDESNAQIFRLRLADGHLQSRLYFPQFRSLFAASAVSASGLLLQSFLSSGSDPDSGIFLNGSAIPIFLGIYAIGNGFVSLARVSFDRSSSKRSEKQISVLFGFLGFLSAVSIISVFSSSIFDFDFGSVDGIAKLSIAVFAGCIAGFLYMPAMKIARSFWLGTDQLRWNLSVVSCGSLGRLLLYSNFLMISFASMLWINPMAEVLIKNKSDRGMRFSGNVGMDRSDFERFRVLCLMVSGVLQILSLRPNLQMYLNEAVLSWYQRLHASKVPDLDFSRAKIFLHNHYVCLVVLQFFVPPALVLVFLGLSQIQGNLFGGFPLIDSFAHCSSFVKEVSLFMSWWIVFVSMIFTSMNLALYRCGILLIS